MNRDLSGVQEASRVGPEENVREVRRQERQRRGHRRWDGKEMEEEEEKKVGLASGDFDLCLLGSLGSILTWNGYQLMSGCQRSLWGTISFPSLFTDHVSLAA